MPKTDPAPRLSTRLLLTLYGQEQADVQKLAVSRKTIIAELERDPDISSSFTIERFIPPQHSFNSAEVEKIRSCFKSFVEEVSKIVDGGAQQRNAAKTMFNIITKRESHETAYKDASSYFGFIPSKTFNKVANLAKELKNSNDKRVSSSKTDTIEFGEDITFSPPSLQLDEINNYTDFDISLPQEDVEDNYPLEVAGSTQLRENHYNWLFRLCEAHTENNESIFDATHLTVEIINMVNEISSVDELQANLFDLLGENGFELMMEIISSIEKIKKIDLNNKNEETEVFTEKNEKNKKSNENTKEHIMLSPLDYENLSANQKKKILKKEEKALEIALKESESNINPEDNAIKDWLERVGFSEDFLARERALGLQKGTPLMKEDWFDNLAPEGTKEYYELNKSTLPKGATKTIGTGFEEIHVPAAEKPIPKPGETLIPISVLDSWAQAAFAGTKKLNRIQSKVFTCAYHSVENMLVCAPTGAGKTNIAMLTFLQLVKNHTTVGGLIDKSVIKAVYIAPMKALAQEVVAKFQERLKPLGLIVKEYTGDMQLTRKEVSESNLLVSTPEKYDVVTRKSGDGSLLTLVNLLIIDEVHLLAEDRGAVIETIVARTQRYVESSQNIVRIVGLSATLPNYQDVAVFLRVNQTTGLFHFGPEYRPIPLEQTFIGVSEKQRVKRNEQMDKHAYEKMITALENGKQVMVFVHSRKETSRTADVLADLAGKNGTLNLLDNTSHPKYGLFKKEVFKSRSKEVQQLFSKGFGTHHAGMLRADRSITEKLFEAGLIKVLCCTATLAWGVNLPAHTVIIKGTEMYDPNRGGFVDISILDVLQIFGRAGRPQYDTTGHAVLITSLKSLTTYLGMFVQQAPIESALVKSLADHLNAEIVNGTVNNIKEAASWLSYTFLFVRMCRKPEAYGLDREDLYSDPRLEKKRVELVSDAADILDRCMMTRFDKKSGNLAVTDLGRIASHYYITHTTMESFNHMLSPHLSEPDALHVLCSSSEFDQLKVRPEEMAEIDQLKRKTDITVRGSTAETPGKVNILLQMYLGKEYLNSFTLQSDTHFVSQNSARISRALFELCLKRGWSGLANQYLTLCKAIDRQLKPYQTPLRQFNDFPEDILEKLEHRGATIEKLLDMDGREIGQLINNQKFGNKILNYAKKLPFLNVETKIQPITRGILRLVVTISKDFEWTERYHGFAQAFWIWVEDGENEQIYHSEYFMLLKKEMDEEKKLEIIIPVREPIPLQYYIRVTSDSWVGSESLHAVSFRDLILPTLKPTHTDLLNIHPIPREALKNPQFESLYKFSHFNPVQSQTFHVLYHTDNNVLVGAPTGSGKTITGELAIMRLLSTRPGAKTIYVAPLKALARERLTDWRRKLGGTLGLSILELTGDVNPDIDELKSADVLIVTPEKWDSVSRGWKKREYVQQVELVIIDEIHLLGVDRGAVLEVIVSRMRFISTQTNTPVRFVGLSTALANPRDLADWLGIGEVGVYNFRPAVRPVPMSTHIQGFPGKHYCPRMATMNKPCYAAIQEHSPHKPTLIFVSSRRQTRLTALDMISYCAADDDPKQFLHMSEEEITNVAETLKDKALRDTIVFGIGIHHAGLDTNDRETVEQLFLSGKIQVLVCTSTLAWGVNLPCHLVIVKGTEYFDGKQGNYVDFPVTDVLQMMGRAGRPQFDETGVACIFVYEPKKTFYRKFLHEPFPVESSLHLQLHEHLNAEIVGENLKTLLDCIEYISWTYYFRRLLMNPFYYLIEDTSPEGVDRHLRELLSNVIKDLKGSGCLEIEGLFEDYEEESGENDIIADGFYRPTFLGKITSFYYLNYKTAGLFKTRLTRLVGLLENSQRNVDLMELIKLLCDAYEFSELPVRHNEELLNAELLDQVFPGGSDAAPKSILGSLDSPHTKAFLLILAHLQRKTLPISDYINDTKTVLDQANRVLNALIDIAAEEGHLYLVLKLTRMSQLLYQGIPDSSHDFHQIPGINYQIISKLEENGVSTVKNLVQLMPASMVELLKECSEVEPDFNVEAAATVVRTLPGFDFTCIKIREKKDENYTLRCENLENSENIEAEERVLADLSEQWMEFDPNGPPIEVSPDKECEIEITLSRSGGDLHAFSPSSVPHKPQKPNFWFILGSIEESEEIFRAEENPYSLPSRFKTILLPKNPLITNMLTQEQVEKMGFSEGEIDLLAMRKLGSINLRVKSNLFFTSNDEPGVDILTLMVLCDSIVGVDISIQIPVVVRDK